MSVMDLAADLASFYEETDPEKRLAAHNAGTASKYTASRRPVELVHLETFETKQEAMKREAAIKKMSRREKLKLIGE